MLLRLATLGAIGYAAYKFLAPRPTGPQDIRLAGGPLSPAARLQHTADLPTR